MSEGTMEFHADSDKEAEGDDSEAENSEEELKRIEEQLYFAIHYGEAGDANGEETANVTVYQDSSVKSWNVTPSLHPEALSTPEDGPTELETSDHKPKLAQTNELSPKPNDPLSTSKRKKLLKSAGSSSASPATPAVSVSSALDSQLSHQASKSQPDQGRNQEQKTQSAHVPAPESCRPVAGQPENSDHVNVATPGLSIGALLKALQVSKHSAWSEDSDSSLDSGPTPQNLRPKTETAATGRTPLKTKAKSSQVSDSMRKSKDSVTSEVCDAVKVDSRPSPLGEKTESAGGAQSSHSSSRDSSKNVVDDKDAGDSDQRGAGLPKGKEMGKNANKKKTSVVRTTRREESSESDTLQKGKDKLSPTFGQPPASKSRELQKKNVRPVQSSGSSSSSGEESDSESSSSDESDLRLKLKHRTKKMLKPSSSTLQAKQKEKSDTAGRPSKERKQTPKSKGSDADESVPAESPVKMNSSPSDSESEPEKPKKFKLVSKVPKKVISCKTDSESDSSGSKEKSTKAQKEVQSAFSTVPITKGQSKQTLESLHPDVSVTVGSDSSMEESDTTLSSEDSDASSKSLDVNDSDFLNQLSDSSLKEDIMYNMSAEDNAFVNQASNSQTVLSTPEPGKWHLNARDQAAAAGVRNSGSRGNRYFMPIRCDNCQEPGHLARDCPKPRKQVCHLCGRLGHIGQRCPERLCYNCDYPGHDARDCPRPRRSRRMICHRCQMPGHKQEECPDQWRQYHSTTSGVVPVKVKEKRNKNISCYNCGALGHLGYECRESRMNSYTMPSYPFVAWYDSAETIHSIIKAAKATKGNEEDNPWRPVGTQDPAGSKRKHEEEYERDSKRRRTSEDSSSKSSNRDEMRKERAAESGKKPGSGRDDEKEVRSGKRTETGRGSRQGDGSSRDVPEAEKKRQNDDVTLTFKSKKSTFSGPLEDFIPLGGGKKDEWKPTNHGGSSRSGFNARPRTGHMARVRRWSDSSDEEPVPLLSTVRGALRENRTMLREVTGDVTTRHLTGRSRERPQGVMGDEWRDSQSERQPVPPKPSRKRRREEETQVYGHHSSQWGEVDNAFNLIGEDIGQLVKDTQDSHSVHGSFWDKLQDSRHTKNFHIKHSNKHQNMWDLPSSSKRGRYDFPRTSQDFQADLEAEPAPKLNRKAQQRAIERAAKESKKALKEQRKLKKLHKQQQQQEQQQRELQEEFGEDYNHQVFNNEWWLKEDASPPSPLPGGKQGKKKGKKKKKKSGNQQDSFEDDEGEDPFLTGIIQRQRKKGKKKSSFQQDTRRKSPNLGVGPKTFRRNSPGASHSGRKVFQKPSPHHHKQNQKHHNQKHEHHGHNQQHHKQNQGRHVSWNSSRRSPGFKRGKERSSHHSHRVHSSFAPEDFPRNHSKGPQASSRGRGQGSGNRGFVSRAGFRVQKDILDKASNFFQNRGRRKNW